jgi:ABC-type Fe3+-siderophore transport system permease subunit
MQALTRNPLASPGLFGVNAGAALMIVSVGSVMSIGLPVRAGASACPALVIFHCFYHQSFSTPAVL